MRSLAAHASGLEALVSGGMLVARFTTASWPTTAAATASGSNRSTATGSPPRRRTRSAFSGPRATAVTSWPAATRAGRARVPTTPVPPVRKIFTVALSF